MYRFQLLPLLLLLNPIPSHGAIILDALEPHCCASEGIQFAPNSTPSQAIGFQTALQYELTSVSFNLSYSSGGTGDFIVDIYNDNGAVFHAPGVLLTSYSVPFPSATTSTFTFDAPAPAGIVLDPGQIYWIAPRTSDSSESALWWYNQTLFGFRAAEFTAGSWVPACGGTNNCQLLGIEVDGAATPEPSTLVACGLAVAAFLTFGRLKAARFRKLLAQE
jgi:hypothetical protein